MKKTNNSKPMKKNAAATQERRFLSNGELRVQSDNNGKKIVGYAAKFSPSLSDDLGGWRERLDPHCFDASLAGNVDCRALWNHDRNHVLGRTTSGTLHLTTNSTGLFYEIDPPDTQLAKDLMTSMERGDVTNSSFAFVCLQDDWSQSVNGDIIRTVLKATLIDVSPVTYPAYPDATSGVRASLRSCPADLRSKLTKRDDDTDDDDDDDDLDCEGEDADDPRCEDRCQCRCKACSEQQDCSLCLNDSCDDDACLDADCLAQITRAAHRDLLLRRLRS